MFITTFWSFSTAGIVRFGKSAVEEIGYAARKLGGTRALIVVDKGVRRAGLCEKIEELLKKSRFEIRIWDGVKPNPTVNNVNDCFSYAKSESIDLIVGLGGGSSIDVAKTVSMLQMHGGEPTDYISPPTGKGRKFPGPGLPIIAIPTTAGTGSEVTSVVDLTLPEENMKEAIFSEYLYPSVAIVDPLLTVSLPPDITAATGMDALAHAIESYTTRRYDHKSQLTSHEYRLPCYHGANPMTDALATQAIRLISSNLRKAVNDGYDLEAREGMSLASLLAGMAFINAGLTAVHAMSNAIVDEFHTAHGATNAALLPYVMQFNVTADLQRFAHIAKLLGEDVKNLSLREAAKRAPIAVKDLANDINIASLTELGCGEKSLQRLAEKSMRVERHITANPRHLTISDVETIFYNALEGKL